MQTTECYNAIQCPFIIHITVVNFFLSEIRAADSPQRHREPNVSLSTARKLRHIKVLVQSHKISMLFYFMQLPRSVSSEDCLIKEKCIFGTAETTVVKNAY